MFPGTLDDSSKFFSCSTSDVADVELLKECLGEIELRFDEPEFLRSSVGGIAFGGDIGRGWPGIPDRPICCIVS